MTLEHTIRQSRGTKLTEAKSNVSSSGFIEDNKLVSYLLLPSRADATEVLGLLVLGGRHLLIDILDSLQQLQQCLKTDAVMIC